MEEDELRKMIENVINLHEEGKLVSMKMKCEVCGNEWNTSLNLPGNLQPNMDCSECIKKK